MIFVLVSLFFSIASFIVAIKLFPQKFIFWEYVILFLAPLCIGALIYNIDAGIQESDKEFFTNTTVSVRYTEPYVTWVSKQCAYDCNCTKDKNGHQTCSTCYKDCSYCDEHSANYEAVSETGKSKNISSYEYNRLKTRFQNSKFLELNRTIRYHGGCGKDGDAYESWWDNDPLKYEMFATEHSYVNKLRLNSSYNFKPLTEVEKKRVFDYPNVDEVYQSSVVGNWYNTSDLAIAKRKLDRFNGLNGKTKQIKVFVFLYNNETPDVADLQRQHFQGGNKNEMIYCIGHDGQKTKWVKSFSWTDEKICENEAMHYQSDTMTLNGFVDHMIPVLYNNWKRKEFTPLNNVLTIAPSTSAWIWLIVVNIIVSVFLVYFFQKNDIYV